MPIFFALSGFLLWYPFAKSLAEGSAMQTPTQFYFRRIRRIMPALLFFTFFYLLLFYTLGPNRCAAPASPGDIATSLLFLAPVRCLLQGNALPDLVPGTWSLTPEMWFYLLLPLLAVITRATSRKLLWLLIPAMLALGTLYQRHVVSDPRFVAHYNLRGCIHTFAWGMAAASLSVACPRIVNRKIFAYLGAALIVFATWYGGFVFGCLDTYFQVGLGAALVIVSVTGAESTIRAVCDAPLLRFIGKVSYSLFLCHVLVAWYFMPPLWSAFHVPPGPARFLVLVFLGVPAAIALATLGYEGIERPWLDKSMASSRFQRGRRTLLAAGGAFAVLCALIAVGEFHRPGCIAEMNGPAVQIVREMSWELSRSSADARGTGLRRTAQAIFRPILDRLRPTRRAVQQELLWSLDREGKTLFEFDRAGTADPILASDHGTLRISIPDGYAGKWMAIKALDVAEKPAAGHHFSMSAQCTTGSDGPNVQLGVFDGCDRGSPPVGAPAGAQLEFECTAANPKDVSQFKINIFPQVARRCDVVIKNWDIRTY